MAVLGGYGLYELRKAMIQSLATGQPPRVQNLKLTCHLGWILGSLIFAYSVIFLSYGLLFVLFFPQLFTPCICGIAIGPVVWVNCCCYQWELSKEQLVIEATAGLAMQNVQVQR